MAASSEKEIAHIVVLVLVLVAVVVLVGVGIAVVVMQDTQLYGIAAWLPSYPEDTMLIRLTHQGGKHD